MGVGAGFFDFAFFQGFFVFDDGSFFDASSSLDFNFFEGGRDSVKDIDWLYAHLDQVGRAVEETTEIACDAAPGVF